MVRILVLAVALAAVGGCGKDGPPAYDRSTPEGAVRALFTALNSHRIPADLGSFFRNDREIDTWRMRCKFRGCSAGAITKLAVVEQFEYRAIVALDYAVRGNGGARVMSGEGSPITLIRDGNSWYIDQFGKHLTVSGGGSEEAAER